MMDQHQQAVFVAAVGQGDLDDEEIAAVVLLLAELEQQGVRKKAVREKGRINIFSLSDHKFRKLFRFRKRHFMRLFRALQLPERIILRNKSTFPGQFALAVVLRRLSYPGRLVDLSQLFNVPVSVLSLLVNETVRLIYGRWSRLLFRLNNPWLTHQRLAEFCQSVSDNGAPYNSIWGFLDGTVMRICRPSRHQRLMYSGHKRVHCVKFQGVMTPCGLIAHLFGPVEGRRHDMAVLELSGLRDDMLTHLAAMPDGPMVNDICLFADQGYAVERFIQTPFRGQHLTAEQAAFNVTMSGLRVSVEWGFGRVQNLFAFCNYKQNLKILLSPVAKYYIVAALLTNCHSCLRRNLISRKFGVRPPHLEEYLQ